MRRFIFSRFLRSSPAKPQPLRRNPPSFRIGVEALEDRLALTVLPPVAYPVDGTPSAIVSADFNGDGRIDLATVNQGAASVSVLRGRADGTFQPPQNSATGAFPQSIAVGDFNEDGKLDLVTGHSGDVNILLGKGDGTFQPPASINLGPGLSWVSVAVGDFNNDGTLDLGAVSSVPYYSGGYYGGGVSYTGRTHVLIGLGNGLFAAPSTVVDYSNGFLVNPTLADFNGDGNLDLATNSVDYGYATWYPGNGDGTLGIGTYFNLSSVVDIAAGDVNGDGRLDLVATSTQTQITVLLNTGGGTFATPQSYLSGVGPNTVAIGDLSGDGKPEIVVSNSALGTVGLLLNTGGGLFRSAEQIDAISYRDFALADFNGDGRADIAAAGGGYNRVDVLLNDGNWPAIDDPSINITTAVTINEGNTAATLATLTVSLSSASSKTVTVQYATEDLTAQASDGDFEAQSGTLTFAPGQTSQTISIAIRGDRRAEYEEMFNVVLSNAVNGYIVGTGLVVITDDEPYVNATEPISLPEGNTGTTPFTFTVTLSAPYDAPVTVDFQTAELTEDEQFYLGLTAATYGVDFVPSSGTLTFAAGETSRTVTVFVNGDSDAEYAETFVLALNNSPSAHLEGIRVFGTILDDEPYVNIFATAGSKVTEGNTGTKAATFTISLSAASIAPVTVNYLTLADTASAGSDYVGVMSAITLAPGQTTATISILVNGDTVAEATERFFVLITGATGATPNNSQATGEIVDDDKIGSLRISDASVAEGNSGTRTMSFTVSLSQASGSQVSVNYTTVNGSAKTSDNDYVASSGTLIFSPGQTTKTIAIIIKGDTKKESNEKFYVKLSGAINATIADGQGDGTILNDDASSRRRIDRFLIALSESSHDNWDRALRRRIR